MEIDVKITVVEAKTLLEVLEGLGRLALRTYDAKNFGVNIEAGWNDQKQCWTGTLRVGYFKEVSDV